MQDEAKGTFPKKTANSGTRPARPSDVSSQIKGPRSKVDGGAKFPTTIRPGSTPSKYK
jgi:hypothetical protein